MSQTVGTENKDEKLSLVVAVRDQQSSTSAALKFLIA